MPIGALRKIISPGMALDLATEGPSAYKEGKKYTQQQRQRRKIRAPHAPGGAPPMRKVSAAEALRTKLAEKKGQKKEAASQIPFGFAKKGLGVDPAAVMTALAVGAGGVGAGLAARGAAKGVGGSYQRFQANRMFQELQRRHPEIKRNKRAREAFDLAVAYAPSLLRHPTAIGDFVKRQLEYPMSSHEFIKQLADLEATVSKSESVGLPAQIGRSFEESVGKTPAYIPR